MQKGDVVGLVIVIVLLGGIGLFFAYAPKAPPANEYVPVEITGSSLTLGEQTDGAQAVVVSAEIKQPGFVTVHESLGEAPGPVIGHSPLLTVGSHENLTVDMTEVLSLDNPVIVLLMVDDGDGVYEPGIDLPVMSDGQVVKQIVSL